MDRAYSKNNVPIRLTEERWVHVIENHNDMAGYYDDVLNVIEDPDFVIRGYGGCLMAVKGMAGKKFLVVVYKKLSPNDGFVVTAYLTSKFSKKEIIWQKKP